MGKKQVLLIDSSEIATYVQADMQHINSFKNLNCGKIHTAQSLPF